MADTDVLPSRGVPRMALVDSTGVATNGSSTIAQLAAKGIQSICAVDATGVSVGGPNVAQLASAGIRSFCPVDENGVAQDSSTAIQLQTRGIRPMVLLGNTGIALTGSSDMPTLARKGLSYFCPVDESGNATTMGPVVLLSNATVQDNITVGTNVGVLSVAGGSGTYNFTLTSNPGSHFALAGTNGVNLNTATAMTVGTYPITVQAAGGVPTPVTRTFAITVIPSPVAPANTVLPVISGSTVVGQTLTTTSGTWTGFPAPGFTYQWQRDTAVAPTYSGPGDSQAFIIWGSVARGYSAAKAATGTTKAFRVVDGSNANGQDLLVLTTGLVDVASLNTWIAAHGTAHVTTVYDQVGTDDWTQATNSKMPTITVSAINGLPALTFVAANSQLMTSATTITQTEPVTLMAVAKHTLAAGALQDIIASTSNEMDIGFGSAANTITLPGNVPLTKSSVADLAFHVLQGCYNGASSTIDADGATQTTGTTGSSYPATGVVDLGGYISVLFLDGMIAEAGIFAGTFSSGVHSNARTAYGL